MKYANFPILVSILAFLAGCITPIGVSKYDFSKTDSNWDRTNHGIIVGSIVRDEDETWDQYRIEIRSLDNKTYTTIALGSSVFWNNEKNIDGAGTVFAKVLPPGEYEIYKHSRYIGVEWMWSDPAYSVRFSIEAGEIKYLGRFLLHHNSAGNRSLLFDWEVVDFFNKDKVYLDSSYPGLDMSNVKVDIINMDFPGNMAPPKVGNNINYAPVEDASPEEWVSEWKASCSEPYRLTQDCSDLSGARREVIIEGIRLKVAGSEDGKIVLIMDSKTIGEGFKTPIEQSSKNINLGYNAVKKELTEQNIQIEKAVAVKLLDQVRGYYLILDGDGYSIIKAYSETK